MLAAFMISAFTLTVSHLHIKAYTYLFAVASTIVPCLQRQH